MRALALLACSTWLAFATPASAQRLPAGTRAAPETPPVLDRVTIEVVDRDGRPEAAAEVRVRIEDETDGSIRDASVPGGWRQGRRFDREPPLSLIDFIAGDVTPIPGGGARVVADVPRGRALVLVAQAEDRWGMLWVPREGPRSAAARKGEPLRLELHRDWPLEVRVLDADGRAAAAEVRLRSGQVSWGGGSAPLTTFAHAGYALRNEDGPARVSVSAPLDPPVEALFDPRHEPPPITLRLPPTGALEVRILDAQERPLRDASAVSLRLVSQLAFEDPHRRDDAPQPLAFHGFVRDGVARFEHVAPARDFELAVGNERFPLRGPAEAGATASVTVALSPPSPPPLPAAASRPEEIPAGLTLLPTPSAWGSVSGSVLLDPDVPVSQILLLLCPDTPFEVRVQPQRDGRFRFEQVPAGEADLVVWPSAAQALPPEQRPAFFTARLQVARGENEPEALAAIDLRDSVFVHRIRVSREDESASFQARVYFRRSGALGDPFCYARIGELPIVLVSPWPSIDVEVHAAECRFLPLFAVHREATARLEPGIPVRLRLSTDGVLPTPPDYLKAALVPDQEILRGIDWEAPAFDASHEVRLRVSRPGYLRLLWIAAQRSERSHGGHVPPGREPQYLTVLDSDVEQVFEVHLSAAELAALFAPREE